jgi:predicted RNase H-like HicB family nuclease
LAGRTNDARIGREALLRGRLIITAMPLTVKVEVDETGTYVAEVEDLPGCVTQATSFDELLRNLREAISGNIEARRALGYAVPPDRRMRLHVEAAV